MYHHLWSHKSFKRSIFNIFRDAVEAFYGKGKYTRFGIDDFKAWKFLDAF